MVLTKAHRCDRCGAQAHVRLRKTKAELLFCHHHHNQNRIPLYTAGWEVKESTPAEERPQ